MDTSEFKVMTNVPCMYFVDKNGKTNLAALLNVEPTEFGEAEVMFNINGKDQNIIMSNDDVHNFFDLPEDEEPDFDILCEKIRDSIANDIAEYVVDWELID